MKRTRWKAAVSAIGLALAALLFGSCGSEDEPSRVEKPPLSAATANRLASLSDRIAEQLDAGDVCTAAGYADDLAHAVAEAELSRTLRPDVEEVSTRLVNEVNCPPPPPPPEPETEEKPKEKQHEEGDERDKEKGGEQTTTTPPGPSGGLPPGQAKLKGEGG